MDKTVYILEDRKIRVEWTILKGTSPVREDFRRALVKVFLIGNCEKYLLEATADRGTLMIDIPEGLEPGLYSLEAIWVKNAGHPGRHDRDLCRSMKQDLFAITEFEEEATNLPEGTVVLKAKSSTATYGYDGLSSYELAVLRGEWNGTEGEWLKHQRYVSVLDGRGDSEVDTMSQKSITEELVKHDTAIEDTNKEIDTAQTDIKNLGTEMKEVQDRLNYIPKESFLSSEPACDYHTEDNQDELTVSRAIKDRFGRIIDEHYVTRETVKDYTQEVVDGSKLEIQPGSVQPEDLSPAVQQMIESAAAQPGHITNLPDEEDLTLTEHNTLQFKDREYNPYNYSGMGKVYLRKHIVNGTNMLTQHMMRKPNTIYVIRYDYCLGGETIEVPEGCVLEFDGGTVRNGKIVGDNTLIKCDTPALYVDVSGIFINTYFCVKWFGAKGSKNPQDNSKFIQRAIDIASSNHKTLLFEGNESYRIDEPLIINNSDFILDGNKCSIRKDTCTTSGITEEEPSFGGNVNINVSAVFIFRNGAGNNVLKNITLYDSIKYHSIAIVYVQGFGNIFKNITTYNFDTGLLVYNMFVSKFEKCIFTGNSRVGIYFNPNRLNGVVWGTGTSCLFDSCYVNGNKVGYNIRGLDYSTFNSCACDHCHGVMAFWQCRGITLNSCGAEDVFDYLYSISGKSVITINSCFSLGTNRDNWEHNYITVTGDANVVFNSCMYQHNFSSFISATENAHANLINCVRYLDDNTKNNGVVSVSGASSLLLLENGKYYFYDALSNNKTSKKDFTIRDVFNNDYAKEETLKIFLSHEGAMIGFMSSTKHSSIGIPLTLIQEAVPGFANNDSFLNLPIKIDLYFQSGCSIGYIVSFPQAIGNPELNSENVVNFTRGTNDFTISSISAENEKLVLNFSKEINYFRLRISLA